MDWRRAPGVLVGAPLLVVLAQGLLAPAPAGASCAGPRVTISSGTVQPGGMVLVVGEGFGTDCNDTGGPGPPLGAPAEGIAVGFAQGGRTTTLGRVDAGDDYRVSLWMRIPETAHAGPAEITLGRSFPATTTVIVTGPVDVAQPGLEPAPAVEAFPPFRTRDDGPGPLLIVAVALGSAALGAFGAVMIERARVRARSRRSV